MDHSQFQRQPAPVEHMENVLMGQ